jgi:hypothetical protein
MKLSTRADIMTRVQVRGHRAEFALDGRAQRRVVVDAADVPLVESRKWYWNCRRGAYCADERVLLTRVLLPHVRGRVVYANGDMADCRRENLLVGRCRGAGVWYDRARGQFVAAVTRAGLRVNVRCRSLPAAQEMRRRLVSMSNAELVAWRARRDGAVPMELAWMGEDVAPLIAARCAHDAVLAVRKGYEAGLMAARVLAVRNGERWQTMN